MTTAATFLTPGATLPERVLTITRATLIAYAGASGDFNPIHWNQRVARSVGLPDVIAHGMLTMALAARAVTEWLGDPLAIVDYGVRFAASVVVPDDDRGVELVVSGTVGEFIAPARVTIALTARVDGIDVLRHAAVVVTVPPS